MTDLPLIMLENASVHYVASQDSF